MGFWSTLGKIGLAAAPVIAAPFTGGASLASLPGVLKAAGGVAGVVGAGLSGKAKDDANNRGAKFDGQLELQRLLMEGDRDYFNQSVQREAEGRASGTDAWQKLLSAQRTLSPGARPQLAGQYSVAPRQATDMERQGADAMTQEVMARLTGGNPIAAPTRRPVTADDSAVRVDPRLLDAGGLEKTAGWLAPILTALGQKRTTAGPMDEIPRPTGNIAGAGINAGGLFGTSMSRGTGTIFHDPNKRRT